MRELINSHRLASRIKETKLELTQANTQIFTRWNNLLQTTSKNEEQLQTDFLNDIFGEVLYYTYKRGETETNLEKEEKTELDGQKPDGILGFFTNEGKDCRVVIELKDSKTNLDAKQNRKGDSRTPVGQAFDYATKYQGIEFVIVSNFKEIRLYKSTYQGKYQEFKIEELANKPDKQKEFQFLFCKQNLIGLTKDAGSLIKKLLDDETKRETEIQNKFYKEYKALREEFVNDILKQNGTTSDTAISKAQKLFDRLLFIRFCEDNNLITKPFEKVETAKQLGLGLWDGLKLLFTSIDKGNPPHIHKFNGGLFASDDVFNDIKIETKLLEKLINFLRLYHFKNDISVNILGHIFEQSITDLEALKAGLNDETHDKNQGKRKKDGIFYTPEYITKYIVEEAVGGWLKERKDELKLDELTPQEIPTIKPKKWINPNQELINRYKEYAEKLKQIKVLDHACGSGAFLVEVFNYLENEWLSVSETLKKLGDDTELGLFNYQTIYKEILQNNIYGVDLNSESVQITKLSLWLKTANSRDELTTLDNNIKVGNSLIDDPNIDPKAFKWDEEFPFKFDVVVGNPPYGAGLSEVEQNYMKKIYDCGSTDTAAIFTYKANFLTASKANISFIIPKSYCYASNYGKLREINKNQIHKLVDCGKVWNEVLLEQVIICLAKNKTDEFTSLKRSGEKFQEIGKFNQNDCDLFGFFINGISEKELNLAKKIKANCVSLNDVARNIPGDPIQKHTTESGEWNVIGGAEIDRFGVRSFKGKMKQEFVNGTNNSFIQENSLLVQNIIAHIEKPIDHIKITACIPQLKEGCIVVNTINQIVCNEGVSNYYIWLLLNHKLVNWYVYRFIYGKAIRTMHFYNPTTSRIPIPQIPLTEQTPFVEKAQTMLELTKQFNELSAKFHKLLVGDFAGVNINNKIRKWSELSWGEFVAELVKQKLAIGGKLKEEWLERFERMSIEVALLRGNITKTDAEIDKMVYALYGLSEEEIGVVENLVV